MDRSLYVVVNTRWLLENGSNLKRLKAQGLYPLGPSVGHLTDGCGLLVKYRVPGGAIEVDDSARLRLIGDAFYIRSEKLCSFLLNHCSNKPWVAMFLEGTAADARCIVDPWDEKFPRELEANDPTLRLEAFGLPPSSVSVVDADQLSGSLYRAASTRDPELFAVHASRFLDAPHILTALFAHLFTIGSDDNLRFPIQVKKIAEQLRVLLNTQGAGVRIETIQKSHLEFWASVQGQRFGFLDGGVARIPALAGLQPMALRVGVYSVLPGVSNPEQREQWRMSPFVLGDLIDRARPTAERPETRRFHEAARYTLEPLTGLQHIKEFPDTRVLLLHGPLITQFLQYDEGQPNFLPFLSPEFLTDAGILERDVISGIANIPNDAAGKPMWNQFMSIYGYVMKLVNETGIPMAGVVERPTGRPVTYGVLERLKDDRVINAAYVERVSHELERYDITDDFLFGCVLRAGEYITPVPIQKNPTHRARDRWQPVVRQYPQPGALLLKTADTTFPFRVEMNRAAMVEAEFLARFLYHTARLLPRYAFPVGLDIVDKYAKIPDWISRGVSAELSAAVLKRALRTGDAHVVMQVRQLLARGPRDFFFRPSARGI